MNIIALLNEALGSGPVGIECNCGRECDGTCTKATLEAVIKELEDRMLNANAEMPAEDYEYIVACERFGQYEEIVFEDEEEASDAMDSLRESWESVYMLMPRLKRSLL